MASFQAKTGWEKPRKRENKNYCSDQFLPTRNREFQKNSKNFQKIKKTPLWHLFQPIRDRPRQIEKKVQKIKKYHYGFLSSQNRLEKAEKERE